MMYNLSYRLYQFWSFAVKFTVAKYVLTSVKSATISGLMLYATGTAWLEVSLTNQSAAYTDSFGTPDLLCQPQKRMRIAT